MTVIAVVAMGEMGAGVAARLVERGARVLTSLAGRSEASAKRAAAAGVHGDRRRRADRGSRDVPVDRAACRGRRDRRAVPAADREGGEEAGLYRLQRDRAADACMRSRRRSPHKKLPFLDGSIIGAAPRPDGSSPRLYMSGPIKGEADTLKRSGIDTRVLSTTLGDASTLKMSYAGITKGFQALGASMALGAGRNGAQAEPRRGVEVQPAAALRLALEGAAEHVRQGLSLGRRDARDRKVPAAGAGRLDHADRAPPISTSTSPRTIATGPQSEIISTLNRFIGR